MNTTTRFGTVQTTISQLGPILRGLQSHAPPGNPLAACYNVRIDVLLYCIICILCKLMLVQTFQNLMRSLDANAAKKAADSANCMAPVLNNVI